MVYTHLPKWLLWTESNWYQRTTQSWKPVRKLCELLLVGLLEDPTSAPYPPPGYQLCDGRSLNLNRLSRYHDRRISMRTTKPWVLTWYLVLAQSSSCPGFGVYQVAQKLPTNTASSYLLISCKKKVRPIECVSPTITPRLVIVPTRNECSTLGTTRVAW